MRIQLNTLTSSLLLTLISLLSVWAGQPLLGQKVMYLGLGLVLILVAGGYWFGGSLLKVAHGAKPLSQEESPALHHSLTRLAEAFGIPKPALVVKPALYPSAFAGGRDPEHSTIAVTAGLLKVKDPRGQVFFLAHEFGHIRNRDVRTRAVAALVSLTLGFGAQIAFLATFQAVHSYFATGDELGKLSLRALLLLIPFISVLACRAHGRHTEFEADAVSATILRDPLACAASLREAGAFQQDFELEFDSYLREQSTLWARYTRAHRALIRLLPASFVRLTETHPPYQERAKRLEQLAARQQALQ